MQAILCFCGQQFAKEPNIYSLLGFVATSWYWNNTWFIFSSIFPLLIIFAHECVWVPASVWWTLYTQLCLPIKSMISMMLLKYGEFLFLQFSFVIHFFNHCTNILDIKKNLERIMEHFARCISHISWTSFQIFSFICTLFISVSLSQHSALKTIPMLLGKPWVHEIWPPERLLNGWRL